MSSSTTIFVKRTVVRRAFFLLLLCCMTVFAFAGTITGTVTDDKGSPLPFASLSVKGTTKGAVANSAGRYTLTIEAGTYTLVCQYVGYGAQEKKVTVGEEVIIADFHLSEQELVMKEVVVKRGEDPALEIMRQAISKREYYNRQADSFTVEVYIKGLMRSRALPDKFMGQKIDKDPKMGVDSAGKGILYLSESVTNVSYTRPNKIKIDVVSSRESGGGFGFAFPFFINFYDNNVATFSNNLNPRGFISPVSDNAFHYYNFRYEGNFFEGNQMIDKIRVRPKRKNEPLFDGYIQIVDGEWRIHSLELMVTKNYGLELLDTLRITQMQAPVTTDVWRTKQQVLYLSIKQFGFDVAGNFLNVYSNYNITPGFTKNHFDRILMKYDTAALKKDSAYWTAKRPVSLEVDERRDYAFKDSVSKAERDSMYSRTNIDSLRKRQGPVKLPQFFIGGVRRNFYSQRLFSNYRFEPLVKGIQYNSVEGVNLTLDQSFSFWPRKSRYNYTFGLNTRYGFANEHLNAFGTLTLKPRRGTSRNRYWEMGGGKAVYQFDHNEPISPLMNSVYTLLLKENYMKIYEAGFGSAEYNNRFESGMTLTAGATFEDRIPLQNATDYSLARQWKTFLPNHPYELAGKPFSRHQAMVASLTLRFQPGQQYIQYPHNKVSVGSKYPTFEVQYQKGIRELFGSDVDFDKWKVGMFDDMNWKLFGLFKYRINVGGFLNAAAVEIPDMQHFNGNQTFNNLNYLNSFQLAPYYRYSNTASVFTALYAEHHFNGLLTNKIPLFNKLKWYLVGGSNAFYIDKNNFYIEGFAGLENIMKILRVDFIRAFQAEPGNRYGIRLGFGGLIGSAVKQEE